MSIDVTSLDESVDSGDMADLHGGTSSLAAPATRQQGGCKSGRAVEQSSAAQRTFNCLERSAWR